MILDETKNNVIYPSGSNGVSIQNQIITRFILTLQMTQTSCFMEMKVEIIFNVCHLDLAPRMAMVLPIHSLHLSRMVV
jgi:hypothetical protein